MSCRTALLALPLAAGLFGAPPADAQGGASCLFSCDSQCYGQPGPYCRSSCMAACNSAPAGRQGAPGGGRSYGALAATASDGDAWGFSFRWATRAEAEREALAQCDQRAGRPGACTIATWCYNRCGALATGSNGAWGADNAVSIRQASLSALRYCRAHDPSGACHVVKAFCTP